MPAFVLLHIVADAMIPPGRTRRPWLIRVDLIEEVVAVEGDDAYGSSIVLCTGREGVRVREKVEAVRKELAAAIAEGAR